MKLFNEQIMIRGISIGLFVVSGLLFQFGITVNNGHWNLFPNMQSLDFYETFGYVLIGSIIPYLIVKRNLRERVIVLVIGAIAAVIIWHVHPMKWNYEFRSSANFLLSGLGFALASIVAVILHKTDDPIDELTRKKLIDFFIFANLIQFSIWPILDLTTLFHPYTFDAIAYRIDSTFGFLPSVLVAKLYFNNGWFSKVLDFAYDWIPLGFAFIFGLQLRQKLSPPANMILVWIVSTIGCLIAYHLCPITGPIYLFEKNVFPNAMPEASQISNISTLNIAQFRNGFPSMHLGACLMMIFTARYQKLKILNCILYIAAGLTVLATLGKGEHYLIDLVVSFPFIVAIQSYCTHVNNAGEKYRKQAMDWHCVMANMGIFDSQWTILISIHSRIYMDTEHYYCLVKPVCLSTHLALRSLG
jgi:hypothetical protein